MDDPITIKADSHKEYEYFAFISYKREDEKWAKWLQHKLEYYKLPSSVRKDNPDLPDKIRPVFKDTTDLEPGVLAQKIQNALDSSKFLIVICSPRSANSIWVSKEVQSFIDSGRADHIIPFIIGGTPNATDPKDECFPEGLRQLAGEQELLGANINEMGREAAAIKVVARMFNLRFDTLWQRFERDRKKRILYLVSVTILSVLAAFVMGYLYFDRNLAYDNLSKANDVIAQTNKNLKSSQDSIQKGNIRLQLAYDSISIVNKALTITRNDLVNRNLELEKAHYSILIKHSDLIAYQINSLLEAGDVPRALRLIRENYCSNLQNSLPLTNKSEYAIRQVESVNRQGDYIHVNTVSDLPFSFLLDETKDILIGYHLGDIVRFNLNDFKIDNTTVCKNKENILSAEYVGFLNTVKSKIGLVSSDSIYIYNADDGIFISEHPWHYMGNFRVLNDSVILAVNLKGCLDKIDSRTLKQLSSTGINGLNPVYPENFKINSKNEIVYVDVNNRLFVRELETGDTLWQRQFNYRISDEIGLLDEINAVAIINMESSNIELWTTDRWEMIKKIGIPESSKHHLCCPEFTNLSLFTFGNNNYKYDRWAFPIQGFNRNFKKGKVYNSQKNYYENFDGVYHYVTSNDYFTLFSVSETDWVRIIKTTDDFILATFKFGDEYRLICFEHSNGDINFHLVSSDTYNNSEDWQHGYQNYMFHKIPKLSKNLVSEISYAVWGQCTDISSDGRHVAAALYGNNLFVRDIKQGHLNHIEASGEVFSIRFTPDKKYVLVTTESGVDLYTIKLEHCRSLIKSGNLFYLTPCISELSPQNNQIAVGYMDGSVIFYSYPDMKKQSTYNVKTHLVNMAYNNTGDRLAVILDSNEIVVLNTENGQILYRNKIPFESSNVTDVFFDNSGEKIIVHTDKDTMIYNFMDIRTIIKNI